MTHIQRLEVRARRLDRNGAKAYAESAPCTKVASRIGALITAPIGTVAGGAVGGYRQVVSSFDANSTSKIVNHGTPGSPTFRQSIITAPSNFVKTMRFLAVPAGIGAAIAFSYNAYSLALTAAGPGGLGWWSLPGTALAGAIGAGIALTGWNLLSGAFKGGKVGFKGGVGAASIVAHRAQLLLAGPAQAPVT